MNDYNINNWRYELDDTEFYKCLYFASFMQKNNFPKPAVILTPSGGWGNVSGEKYVWSASAIKYAMCDGWKDSIIYHGAFNFMTSQGQIRNSVKEEFINIRIMKGMINFFKSNKNTSDFYLVLDRENSVVRELKLKLYPEIQICENTGNGILLCADSVENIFNKTENYTQLYNIELDAEKIPRTRKLSNTHYNFTSTHIDTRYPFINNSHNSGNDHLCKSLSEFVKTFQKEPYSLKQIIR